MFNTESAGATPLHSVARVSLFGIQIDPVNMGQAVDRVMELVLRPGCDFVVTPNVDHVLRLQKDAEMRRAYAAASLVVADGWPVVSAARLLGAPLPERVPGSDLVPAVLARASSTRPLGVFLLGAGPGVADRAAERIEATHRHVRVVGTCSPPIGFDAHPSGSTSIVAEINRARPELLVIGLGAPKQERWILEHAPRLEARVALCVGATIDFLAGEKRRAPRWVQTARAEWLYRMLGEPTRLTTRYAQNALGFPLLVAREARRRSSGADGRAARNA